MLAADQIDRYLRLLGVNHESPSLQTLTDLVRGQLCHVPFENISKLYGLKRFGSRALPSMDAYLDGIEFHHFGGTCYSCNSHFYQLLQGLGYAVRLCGADMNNPDVHLVNVVELDGREYLVDCGYAAPFLQPMPLDLQTDYAVELGNERYILKPRDQRGRTRLEFYRDGELKHGYEVNPKPRRIEEFEQVIADSYRPSATFLNALLLTRFLPDRALRVHNLKVIESIGRQTDSRDLGDKQELFAFVEQQFGIARRFTEIALDGVTLDGDAWS